MTIQVGGTTVIDQSRQVQNVRDYVQVIGTNTAATASYTYVLTASLTLTLPASPTAGDFVKISNRSNTLTCVVARNGQPIMGVAEDMTIDAIDVGFMLVYADATRGWVIV
mgnify:CR=1 FL=1